MSASAEPLDYVCRMALISELLNRSMDRLKSLRDPSPADYKSILAEVETIVGRVRDLVGCVIN